MASSLREEACASEDVEEIQAVLALLHSRPVHSQITDIGTTSRLFGVMLETMLEEERKPNVDKTTFCEERKKKRCISDTQDFPELLMERPAKKNKTQDSALDLHFPPTPDKVCRVPETETANSGNSADRPFKCTFKGCDVSFSLKSNLTVHYRIHTGEKPYKCSYEGCNAVFRHKSSLNQHLKTHTGERPHKCNHEGCNAAFIQKHHLTIHYRTHSGDRPFKCNFPGCTSTFVAKSALVSHARTHNYSTLSEGDNSLANRNSEKDCENKPKEYKCKHPNCSASFSIKSGLTIHERTHSGDRPYRCKVEGCNASFSAKSALTKHSKRHIL